MSRLHHKRCPIINLELSMKKRNLFWGVVGLPFLVSTAAWAQASTGETEKAGNRSRKPMGPGPMDKQR